MPKLEMITDGHLGGFIRGGDPGTWCPHLWTWMVDYFDAKSVLDVGCGEGHSTRYFKDLGCNTLGVEGSREAIENSLVPECLVQHDFCQDPFSSDQGFDLIWSCEFLEHVEEKFLPNILQTFSLAKKAILVTHAFPGQDDGHHHVNCRNTSYWIRKIEPLGFRCDIGLSQKARTVTLEDYPGTNHFARSGLVFVRVENHPIASSGLAALLSSKYRGFAVNAGFHWSPAYRRHRRKRRAAKRADRRPN